MSGEIALWAARQQIDNPVAKLVLIALGDAYDDRTGKCFPSHESISDFVCRSEGTIKRAILWLEENGWIKREARFTKTGRQTANGYELIFERFENFQAMVERRRKMRGKNGGGGQSEGGVQERTWEGSKSEPPKGSESGPPRTESLLNKGAQAREIDKSTDEGQKEKKWRRILTLYRENGKWAPFNRWGPKMGEPGCLVPPHLVKLWNDTNGLAFKPEPKTKRKADDKPFTPRNNGFRQIGTLNLPGTSHD
jgi:hypothetical protein